MERATLVDGASALLYTDGLIERLVENLDEGMARLTAAVAEHCRAAGRAA